MTVAEELENRGRCGYGLGGVTVAVDDAGAEVSVASTRWGPGGVLELSLADGRTSPADRLSLRSAWPVVCREPRTPNAWDRVRHDRPARGIRPPL